MSDEKIKRIFGGIPEEYLPIEQNYVDAREKTTFARSETHGPRSSMSPVASRLGRSFLVGLLNECELVPGGFRW